MGSYFHLTASFLLLPTLFGSRQIDDGCCKHKDLRTFSEAHVKGHCARVFFLVPGLLGCLRNREAGIQFI